MTSVIIGTPDSNLASDLSGILDELGDYTVEAVLETTDALLDRTRRANPMVVLVDENLGPQPTSVIVGELSRRAPGTSVLVVAAVRTQEKTIQAMAAGARGAIGYPFAYEDVATQLDTAVGWSNSMRSVLEGAQVSTGRRAKVVAVVGAKGGAGTTTVAVHMALDHLRENPEARVCVVDADVEKGDVSALLEVRQAVSIANVARVSDDMTAQTVRDSLVHHETGLYMMLSPVDVRESEYVTPDALRAIIELLRRDFDLVVVDGGGHVSPTQAAVIEAAGMTLVVTTADVLAVRAMRKRMQAWEALGVTDEASCLILVNQVDKASLFPSNAVQKLTTASVLGTTIPLSPRVLEQAINDRDPRSVTERGWWRLIRALRSDLGLSEGIGMSTPAAPPAKPEPRRRRRKDRKEKAASESTATTEATDRPTADSAPKGGAEVDSGPTTQPPPRSAESGVRERGAVALENAAMIPLAVLLAVIGWQVAVTGLTFIYTGHASGVATREWAITSDENETQVETRDAVPEVFRSGVDVSAHDDIVTVSVDIPASVDLPGLPQQLTVTEGVVMEP